MDFKEIIDFISQIEQGLKENNPSLIQRRKEAARQHSWENRADEVWEKIMKNL